MHSRNAIIIIQKQQTRRIPRNSQNGKSRIPKSIPIFHSKYNAGLKIKKKKTKRARTHCQLTPLAQLLHQTIYHPMFLRTRLYIGAAPIAKNQNSGLTFNGTWKQSNSAIGGEDKSFNTDPYNKRSRIEIQHQRT